nr:MAG TPA: activating signal cointegrator [Caudoviricetes sp.]
MATDHYDIAVKVAPHYLYDAASGKKTFTVRKYDRPYSAGKILRAYIPGFDKRERRSE